MKKEIRQPQIEVPSPELDISWATLSAVRTQWLREIAPQLGLESKPLVMADVITTITGDDYGALGAEHIIIGNPENAALSKRMLLARLKWELSVTELPTKLKDLIALAITHIERYDFSKPKQFRAAKDTWLVFKDEVEKLVRRSESLTAAVEYHHEHSVVVNEKWDDFLRGGKA